MYSRYLADRVEWIAIEIDGRIVERASELVLTGRFGTRVRAADAIQLASAERWFERARDRNIDIGAFIVADRHLRDAALALGLPVENPEDYE